MHDDPDDKKPLPKMRSSIACYRCRRSKIKCQNNGVNTACRACANQSRECTYPEPSASQQANKRPESTIAARVDGEGGDVKRVRKRESDAVRKQSFRQSDDPLESPPITAKLWKDVYTTFMLHCSTELPFLHEEVFHTRVHQPAAERSADTQIFLLGMLTLTARFIPDLVAYHSQSDPSDPLAASEFYAEAFAARLDAPALTGQPSLERVQGLLMISLYHWGMCRGQRAWMYITIAIGMARTMGLMFEEDSRTSQKPALIEEARQLGVKLKVAEAGAAPDEQTLIQREIKRRTAYSCFILDRYQASGRYRPQIINIDDLHVQLPCSEEDFQFGVDVKTGSLKDTPRSPDSRDGSRTISSTNVLSIYIRLVEIWGRFSRWSCRGGRREEQYPPWDQRSEFYKLRQQLVAFHESLPPKLTFSPTKIAAHIASKSITLYTAIHTLYSLCNIVLHREYIPFIPIRSVGPSGPLDEPTFPPDKYDIPEGFWDESAELIFKSARDIMDIVRVTSDRQVMVESPQVGFAVWTAAFVGIYAVHFPWMDKNSYMSNSPTTPDHNPTYPTGRHEATDLAVKTLNLMLPRSKMACGWSVWIKRMEHYFVNIKKDHNRSIRALGLPSSEHQRREAHAKELSLREGGHGGGLEEYKLLEKELKDFGPSLEQDRYDSPDRISPFSATNGGSRPSTHIKAEPQPSGHARSASRNGNDNGWVTVNTTAPPSNGSVAEEYTPSNKGYVNHHASPKNTATYYPQNSTYAAATTLNSMYPRPANGTTNSTPYDHPSQSSPETYKPGPPASTSSGNWASPKPSPESAFRRLEEISMHGGKDLEIFGTGMDMETDIWANGYVMDDGMGVNFMQAVVWGPQ